VQGRLEPTRELRDRRLLAVALADAGDEDDVGRRVGLKLVLDRLEDVLVPDPGLGVDPGLGERRDGGDEALLGGLPGALDVGRPAVEEPDPRRREDEDVQLAGPVQAPASTIAAMAEGSSTGRVTTRSTWRRVSTAAAGSIGPRGFARAAITSRVATATAPSAVPAAAPPT